jgi:hypothetical protein
MSVEVMQWLRGEIDKDLAEGKKITLDFVSRLNEEVIRLNAWVHELKSGPEKAVTQTIAEIDEAKASAEAALAASAALVASIPPTEAPPATADKVPLDNDEPKHEEPAA